MLNYLARCLYCKGKGDNAWSYSLVILFLFRARLSIGTEKATPFLHSLMIAIPN
jgi:hypothetical protein